ncbi:MAG: glycosyltransferase family 39 protein, partial [Holophagales bacterium]|nr:glycosyltransferase family 39 protein [Holophagales bacterium]
MPDAETRSAWERRALWGLLALALLVRLPWLTAELDDLDSWRQTDTATIARNFLEEPRLLWPRIDWGAPEPGYVEAELQLYPYGTHLLYRAFGEDPRLGRGLSILLSLVSCWVLYQLARRILGGRGEGEAGVATALLALAFFSLVPLSIRYGRSFMPEATVLLFYLLAVQAFLTRFSDRQATALVPAGAWMALAILVKPTSIHLGLILALWAFDRDGPRILRDRRLWLFALLALLPPALYYLHEPERSRRTFLGEWLETGDKYYEDDDGYFWHAGRSDDMLKVGGIWVSPVDVESTLIAHEAVLECAVVGMVDQSDLVKPKAFVVLQEGVTG